MDDVSILCCNAQLQNRNYPRQQERTKQVLLRALAQHTTTLTRSAGEMGTVREHLAAFYLPGNNFIWQFIMVKSVRDKKIPFIGSFARQSHWNQRPVMKS